MKKFFLFLLLLSSFTCINSQVYFTKVTTGIVATDMGSYTMNAWGDYDDNGYQDLVVVPWNDGCWNCSSAILVYLNNGDGSFVRGTNLNSDLTLSCNGVAWGDYSNDGRLDLYITRYFSRTKFLYKKNPTEFSQVSSGPIVTDLTSSTGCSWADYDRNGWLDMFVSNGQNQNNALYRNNGNDAFVKVTTGSIVTDGGDSRSCGWGDYNNDGWPDLFVVNYSGQNCFLYKNNGNGTFTKITDVLPVQFVGWGAGCAWGDYDNDGWLDLIVTYNNESNRLYHNERNGTFSLSNTAPSMEFGWSYYPCWGDINNDGYLDLFVPKRSGSNNALYINNNGNSFTKITTDIVGQEGGASDAGTMADYDNDGKLDLFVSNGSTSSPIKNYLYKNVTDNSNKYIVLKLSGCTLNKSAIGAKITLKAGNTKQTRVVQGGGGSQSMLWQHFGLGNSSVIDTIKINWTTGSVQVLTNVTPNQFLSVSECLVGIVNNELPVNFELKQNYPNPFNPATEIEYSIMKSGKVKLSVFDLSGRFLRSIVDGEQTFGTYIYSFDASGLSSGVYVYKLDAPGFSSVKKMVLIK